MIEAIKNSLKKVLVRRQDKQAQKLYSKNFFREVERIQQGIEDRGF